MDYFQYVIRFHIIGLFKVHFVVCSEIFHKENIKHWAKMQTIRFRNGSFSCTAFIRYFSPLTFLPTPTSACQNLYDFCVVRSQKGSCSKAPNPQGFTAARWHSSLSFGSISWFFKAKPTHLPQTADWKMLNKNNHVTFLVPKKRNKKIIKLQLKYKIKNKKNATKEFDV